MKFDKCPYCSGKLIHGYIKTRGEALTWSTDSKIPVFPDRWHYLQEDVKLGNFHYFKGDKIDAYRCDTCYYHSRQQGIKKLDNRNQVKIYAKFKKNVATRLSNLA